MGFVYKTLNDSPRRSQAWTPSDTAVLPAGVRGVLVATDGDLAITWADGTEDILPLAAATYYGLDRPLKIRATGTTATGVHLLF